MTDDSERLCTEVYERLRRYSFDAPETSFRFAARLARDNGWNESYAERVLDEYKRFVCLCVVVGHALTPSEQVDQAWHLHLVYTESYWLDFCPQVLGRALHHRPTRGGADQRAKFNTDYAATRASYVHYFGAEPPRDIWPPPERRFGSDLCWVRVNTTEHWVWPRPRWWRAVVATWRERARSTGAWVPGGAAAALLFAGCALRTPLDLRGGPFLCFWLALWAVTLFGAHRLLGQKHARTPDAVQALSEGLDAYEVAYIGGGSFRAVTAALASEVAWYGVQFLDADGKMLAARAPAPGSHPLEQRVFEAVASGVPVARIPEACHEEAERLAPRLRSLGLLMHKPSAAVIALLLTAPVVGVLKVFVGMARQRPVAELVCLCLASWLVAGTWYWANERASGLGRAVQGRLRAQRAPLRRGVPCTGLSPQQHVPWAVALFGTGVFAGWGLEELATAYRAAFGPADSGGGGGGDAGGGGDGGGGAGGGDGGCGGCGGCGG